MSESRFAQYVTSTAFNLKLSKANISALECVCEKIADRRGAKAIAPSELALSADATASLERKGIIWFNHAIKMFSLTSEGEYVARLLVAAGLLHLRHAQVPEGVAA